MEKLILENFRCFAGRQEIPLAPLTLLVGENSTGKSSFLAAVRLAWAVGHREELPDFNEEPFLLGAYEQIANYRGGRGGRAKSFSIGYEDFITKRRSPVVRILATFHSQSGQPSLAEWSLESGDFCFKVLYISSDKVRLIIQSPNGNLSEELRFPFNNSVSFDYVRRFLLLTQIGRDKNGEEAAVSEVLRKDIIYLDRLIRQMIMVSNSRPYAIAPIRSKPRRTYDPTRDTPQPEGEHVPMVLARIVSGNPKEWLPLKESLEDFGQAAGLFEEIEVKKLGGSESSPFQIRVKIKGPAANLMDVGYGVSQIIPVLVDSFRAEENQILLLQQPEVHLHPRAQAELGTFLANLVKHDQKQFIIETHSDYLLDRVCLDVRDGKTLRPEDVLILFFERVDSEVVIHPITIDQYGNIQNAPPNYRRFFLQEEERFLGL